MIIRDQNLPMPAGASLISPWVDLTHSFPSITAPTQYDYVPNTGFHAKHSMAWPPPPTNEMEALGIKRNPLLPPDYTIEMNGQPFTITEQINMYAQNLELVYPMVSPIHAASLGGFCPCQVLVGGGEVLRDEQIYLAHKMANPHDYDLFDMVSSLNGENPADKYKYPPTDVQLLVFDDGPHAAPTLGHIDVAKFQYRAISQFAAWALARAQNAEIEIEDFVDEYATPNQTTPVDGTQNAKGRSDSYFAEDPSRPRDSNAPPQYVDYGPLRAGYPLPPFEQHMNRFRVTRQGKFYPMEPPSQVACLNLPTETVGLPKGDTLAGWIKYKADLDSRFASDKRKGEIFPFIPKKHLVAMLDSPVLTTSPTVKEKRLANAKKGYIPLPNGEIAPPAALVGRRVVGEAVEMEAPAVGLTNSLLAKLFRSIDSKGAAPPPTKTTQPNAPTGAGGEVAAENLDGEVSARRSSRIVRPDSQLRPITSHGLHAPLEEDGEKRRQISGDFI